MIFEGGLGEELFMADSFSRSLVVFLEEKLKEREVKKVDEFEAFLDNLESWFVCHITKFNNHKKRCILKAHKKLENISATSIFESLSRLEEDEVKHFILKNQMFIEHKKLGEE